MAAITTTEVCRSDAPRTAPVRPPSRNQPGGVRLVGAASAFSGASGIIEGSMKSIAALARTDVFGQIKMLLVASVLAVSAASFAGVPAAVAASCAKGFYACNINADGSLDRQHPGCCVDASGIGIRRACGPGFYSCRFNDDGSKDAAHPGCCVHVPGIPHVR